VRAEPGSGNESIGLFHQTFARYLLDQRSSLFEIQIEDAHHALAADLTGPGACARARPS
jgi:hypothetical protein